MNNTRPISSSIALKQGISNGVNVAAIIPAYNEENTIGKVIGVIRRSGVVDEIIVVSDGSTDNTVVMARGAGAEVFARTKNQGKGEVLKFATSKTSADIFFFCDADLVGLRVQHVRAVVEPVRSGTVAMCIGLRDRWGIPGIMARLDPLFAIGGERALQRDVFQHLTKEDYHGFSVEISLNEYCKRFHFPVTFVEMVGVTHVPKEMKWGGMQGFLRRIPWLFQILRVRILAFFPRQNTWHKHT